MSGCIVLNPVQGPIVQPRPLAKRKPRSDVIKVAVINNGKRNADIFLQALVEALKEEGNVELAVWWDKPNQSVPVEEEVMERLTRVSDVMLTGVGD